MSRAHRHYPVASTSYHQPPSTLASHRIRTAVDRRQALASAHPDFSQDIYIPESQEELNRVNIESRLLQPSGPSHKSNMRRADLTSASSTFDTYDRIGREDDLPSTRAAAASTTHRPSRLTSDRPHHFDADESLIPGVGRGVRSTMPSQTSYQERIRSLNHHAAQNRFESSPSRSPYRPGKFSSGYVAASSTRQPVASSTIRPSMAHARAGAIPRAAAVESESESDGDSATDSGESDAMNIHTATFNSTGNHRNFAATPAGHTVTMTQNLRQRPTLGQDTLDRIDFDIHTDTDGEHRPSSRIAASTRGGAAQHQQPRPDPTGPFASPRATNTFGMKAADYQQHLASRTLTSPALRTLIGDRSKSPDSPTPAPSIDGRLHAGKTTAKPQQPRAARQSSISAISAFEDLARRLQKDVELTQRNGDARGEEVDDGSASNSGGSGFGPGSQASSARTRVDNDAAPNAGKAFQAAQFNSSGYPAHQKTVAGNDLTSPWGVRLPDVTGLTSALGSPVKARDAVKHRPFDGAVGNQEARLEELVNLRCFVDGIQVELDRAGERILNLEQAQEQQSHEFQGLRSEMQSALKDVRSQQPASDEHLMQLILEKLQGSDKQPPQTQKRNQSAPATSEPQTQREPPQPVQDTRATQQAESRSQVEVVNRLYAELDKLRMTMEQQYRNAAGYSREGAEVQVDGDARPHHAAYKHRDNFPSGRDPWDAIEALRLQVLSLADEVEGLNGLVLDHFVQPPTVSRKRSTRSNAARHRFERDERYYEDAHPASDPVYSARGASARSSTPAYRERDDIRTDPIDDHIDDYYHRRVSFHRQRSSPSRPTFGDDEYDRTIDAVSENLRVQRERQRRRHESQSAEPAELDDYEISQLADTRAALASARASPPRNTHDPQLCTVCASSLRSDKRKASRRARLLAAEQRRELVDVEESILLGQSGPVNEEQRATLRVILQEHWDEFLHQRMLYSELADELKTMEPGMSKAKRRILAQHVLEAVELLELKADRIERLQKLIGSERSERTEAEKVRKEAGSRQASKGEGNRLKHAMESFERTSRSSRAGGRNSPPTTMQL